MARAAMVQAGDKLRIEALIKSLLSVGVCKITREEAESLNLPILEKKYSFMAGKLTYVLLSPEKFEHFEQITHPASLEAAHMRNGLLGIQRRKPHDNN